MTAVVQESAAADLVNASEAAEVVNFLSGQQNSIKTFQNEGNTRLISTHCLYLVLNTQEKSHFY